MTFQPFILAILLLCFNNLVLCNLSNEKFELEIPSSNIKFGQTLNVKMHIKGCMKTENDMKENNWETKKVCLGLHSNDDGNAFDINVDKDSLWCSSNDLKCNSHLNEIELPELGLNELVIGNHAVNIYIHPSLSRSYKLTSIHFLCCFVLCSFPLLFVLIFFL